MRRLTTEEFIKRSTEIHGDFYDYSNTVYVTQKEKVTITCPIHGDFEQFPLNHYRNGCGCDICGAKRTANSQRKGIEDFIIEANIIHDDFYTYENSIYDSARRSIIITCPIHGDFNQLPTNHLKGVGCSSCHGGIYNASKPTLLYYLSINDGEAYKIGITCQSITARFSVKELTSIKVLRTWDFPDGRSAYDVEQLILKNFIPFKYTGLPLLLYGNTELFNKDLLEEIEEVLKTL